MATAAAAAEPSKAPKITLYWLNKSRAQRIVWLLEELKVDYDIKTYKRGSDMAAPKELKEIHPLGKSPVVSIETPNASKPIILAESGLITEYLIDHFAPHLAPKRYKEGYDGQVGGETDAWMRYRYFLHYSEGSLMPPLLMLLIAGMIKNAPVPFFLKFITGSISDRLSSTIMPRAMEQFDFLESQLVTAPDGGPFMCGKEITGADIMLSFPIQASHKRVGLTKEKYPKLIAYIEAMEALPAYKSGVQKIKDIDGSYDGESL